MVIDIHDKAVGKQQADRCAQSRTDGAVHGCQRDADEGIHHCHHQINDGTKLMLIDRTLNFDPCILDEGDHRGQDKQKRHRICIRIFFGRINMRNKIFAKEHDTAGDQAQDHALHTANFCEQRGELDVHRLFLQRCDAVDAGCKHRGNGRGKIDECRIEQCPHAIHRHRAGPYDPAQDKLIDRPVDLVYDHIEEEKKAERADLPQQRKAEMAEGKRNVQPAQAKPDVGGQFGDRDGGRHADDGHRAVAGQQQRQADQRIENNARQLQNALKEKLLVGADHRVEHRRREGQRHIENQNLHQRLGLVQLGRGQVRTEQLRRELRQCHAADDGGRAHAEEEDQKHTVQPCHAIPIAPLRIAGIEPQIRPGKPEAEQAQVADHAADQRVQAVLALAQQPDHDRRVDQLHDHVQTHGEVGKENAEFELIKLHFRIILDICNLYVERYAEKLERLGFFLRKLFVYQAKIHGFIQHKGAVSLQAVRKAQRVCNGRDAGTHI